MSELIVSKFRPLCERLYRCSTINFPDRHFTVDELVKVWESTEDGYNLLSQRVKEVEARTPGIGFPECKMDMVAFGDVVILREIGFERQSKITKGVDVSEFDKLLVQYISGGVQVHWDEQMLLIRIQNLK